MSLFFPGEDPIKYLYKSLKQQKENNFVEDKL